MMLVVRRGSSAGPVFPGRQADGQAGKWASNGAGRQVGNRATILANGQAGKGCHLYFVASHDFCRTSNVILRISIS